MRVRLLLVTVAGALLVGASPASAKPCGNFDGATWTDEPIVGAGIYNVRASDSIPCRTARRVARYAYRDNRMGAREWTYDGYWRCMELASGYEYVKVRCRTPSGRRVLWEAGA